MTSAMSGSTVRMTSASRIAGGVAATAAEADQQADQDRQAGEQDHEQDPPPAEQAAQRDRDERPECRHRRTR